MRASRIWTGAAALTLAVGMSAFAGTSSASSASVSNPAASPVGHVALNCEYSSICAEVGNPQEAFGSDYVGHDEPSAVFYSTTPGSGNHVRYRMQLPHDPSPQNPNAPGKSYQFELNGALWLGMAMCDTQSYPEQLATCTPDSDSNIVDPAVSPQHAGTAFTELQFYPPGWVPWPTWAVAVGASTCDPTKWCAALNIFGLSEDPVAGTLQNPTCAARVGIEYVNFAFVTKTGVSQAPANPVDSTLTTFTPDPSKDLFMNSGDQLEVTQQDTPDGLRVDITDQTTGVSGSMTASPANGFAQIKYDPAGTSCTAIPYAFHPMYSTSSPQTRVIWAAHTYNVGFSDEIGHFETCTGGRPGPPRPGGRDPHRHPIAGPAGNSELTGPTDADDDFCFPGSQALLVRITGCTDTNVGFDSLGYQPVWPDGNRSIHPSPILFGAPRTGPGFDVGYPQLAFEADLPRIEGTCNRATGAGCTLIPTTDAGTPAAFYPFFSTVRGQNCMFAFGNDVPGSQTNFGRNTQYGTLLTSSYLAFGGGGASINRINNFRQILTNPC